MGSSAPKLLGLLGILVVALILVLVSRNSPSAADTAAQTARDEIKQSAAALKDFSYTQYARYMADDLKRPYQAHGDVPVVAGPTGRPNPFAPY